MKQILQNQNRYLLRFDRGEDAMEGIKSFCVEQGIVAADFTMIGAVSQVVLSYYNISDKKYEDHETIKDLEITSVIGNVAQLNGDIVLHAHGNFSDRGLKVIGGHIKKMVISGTGEVVFTVHSDELRREYDEESGLNLLK